MKIDFRDKCCYIIIKEWTIYIDWSLEELIVDKYLTNDYK